MQVEGSGIVILARESLAWAEVISVTGEIDIASVPEFRAAIERELEGTSPVVVDLSTCTYLDSTILRVLVGAYKAHTGQFGIIVPLRARIRRIFHIAGLESALGLLESREDARKRF